MPKPYPPVFRRRALDLLESGRSVRDVAASLGIAESCLHRWKRQDLIDRGLKPPSPAEAESVALAQARARIAELENEVKILRKAAAAVEQVVPPKARFALVAELAVEGVPVKQACLALGVSRSGFYDARTRPPSARVIRQAWLTDQITAIHQASRQTYGSPRVRAELVQGQGVVVSRKTVAVLMRRAGLAGLPLRRRAKRVLASATVTDLVKRNFHREGPNQLWVTDITEHPTREGKLYCCVVLDAFSRRVVGWAIDSRHGPTWRPRRWAWRSIPAAVPDRSLMGSSTQITAPSSPHGPSPNAHGGQGCRPPWEPSATPTTMPWPSRSGHACRPNSWTGNAGEPASNSPTRSSSTSKGSTTATDATPPWIT
ncbi:hypothetical protein GCM10023085_33340 [Actinomadura viridis]|uniref:Transposase-like protein n=1 Tax=Actinomadura viridis TaxID=58110 RepID=A0A931DHU8_9ACTN|nr:transposase-like protein [Actinomadura viridis]